MIRELEIYCASLVSKCKQSLRKTIMYIAIVYNGQYKDHDFSIKT